MLNAQQRIVGPLGPAEQAQFMTLLKTLIAAHEAGRRVGEPAA
jgi:hypothetical protein